MRFGLASLLVCSCLIGSLVGLYLRNAPWVYMGEMKLSGHGTRIAPDGKRRVELFDDQDWGLRSRIIDMESGDVLWTPDKPVPVLEFLDDDTLASPISARGSEVRWVFRRRFPEGQGYGYRPEIWIFGASFLAVILLQISRMRKAVGSRIGGALDREHATLP